MPTKPKKRTKADRDREQRARAEQARRTAIRATLAGGPAETIEAGAAYLLAAVFPPLDAAVRAGDATQIRHYLEVADVLAETLNGGTTFGMNGGEDRPVPLLEAATRAPVGTVPLWGQQGEFTITVARGCQVRIEFDGVYGISLPGFNAHAVQWALPFISETGYRSFLIGHLGHLEYSEADTIDPHPGPDEYAAAAIEAHINGELKGRLVRIKAEYADRAADRAARLDEPDIDDEAADESTGPADLAAIAAAQTTAISESRAAALADAPFALTPTTHDDTPQQGRLF